jgi:chromosome segregation ATPase
MEDVTAVSFPPLAVDFHEIRHDLRNRLNDAGLSLALLRHQLHKGQREDAEETLNKIEEELRALRQLLEPSRSEETFPLPS